MYSCHARAELVCMWDKIHVTLFCSMPNSEGCPLIYKIHKWIKVLVSSRLLEKGRGDTIFGSLKEYQAGGVGGSGMWVGENRGGVGSGREPKGHGGEWWGKGWGENIDGYDGWGMNGDRAGTGCCWHSAWFSFWRVWRFEVSDSTFLVKPLIAARASWSCWSKEAMMGGDDGGEDGVEMSEKVGEVWR